MYQFLTMAQFQNAHQQISYYLFHHCLTKALFESGCQICPILPSVRGINVSRVRVGKSFGNDIF